MESKTIRRTKRLPACVAIAGLWIGLSTLVSAQEAMRDVEYEMKVQRDCEAAIWAIPAVCFYDIEPSIQSDLGGKFGDVVYFSKPMTSRHGFLTANNITP